MHWTGCAWIKEIDDFFNTRTLESCLHIQCSPVCLEITWVSMINPLHKRFDSTYASIKIPFMTDPFHTHFGQLNITQYINILTIRWQIPNSPEHNLPMYIIRVRSSIHAPAIHPCMRTNVHTHMNTGVPQLPWKSSQMKPVKARCSELLGHTYHKMTRS